MACDDIKIAINLQYVNFSSNGDSGDKAVGQSSNGLARAAALPEHRRCGLVVAESVNWDELASSKQGAKSRCVGLITATREYLHHDDLGCMHGAV